MNETEKLREKIDGILKAGDLFLNPPDDLAEFIDNPAVEKSRTDQVLKACKEAGLEFVISHGSYGYEAELEEIELEE